MIKFYQYRSAEITKIILKDSTLKFTNPMDFNDPFDFHPTVPDVGFNKFIKRVNGVGSNEKKKAFGSLGQRYSPVSRMCAQPNGDMWGRNSGGTSNPSFRRSVTA
jgi:hypothetical protein